MGVLALLRTIPRRFIIMATPGELARLRQFIDELDESDGWTDIALEIVIEATMNADESVNLRAAAAEIWESKAAKLVALNDVTESGSSRRLSQSFDHAMKMAALFGNTKQDPTIAALEGRPQSQKVVRATRG